MLGKVVLLAGAGAAYVLRTPEGRARVAQLFTGAMSTATGGSAAPAPAQLPAGGAAPRPQDQLRPPRRRLQVPRRSSSSSDETVPRLVDRRPEGSAVDGVPDEVTGAHLLPDATPVEIARAVSEEQARG